MRNYSELDRISAGAEIAGCLLENGWEQYFEPVPTTISTQEKQELRDRQKREGREGEVWKLASCRYVGSDDRTCDWVRTKYFTDIVGMVTGLTPTTVAGCPFGVFVISLPDGSEELTSLPV